MGLFATQKERQEFLERHSHDEAFKMRKDMAVVTSERYKTPKTSPLIFHFEPQEYVSSGLRLQDCTIEHHLIEGKDVYFFDDFFLESEKKTLRAFSAAATFGKDIYADHSSKEKGEEPAKAMGNKEKWTFFANPPDEVKEIYKLLSFFAARLDADVTTQPWELYDKDICTPAVATNWVESMSCESMKLGRHDDYDTQEGIAFGIPILYAKEGGIHPNQFVNGAPGKPWLVTIMFYATSKEFKPEYGMGSIFCTKDGEIALRGACGHMRFVLFEGDIVHGVEESRLPPDVNVWRVSYVYKLTINPKKEGASMKQAFYDLLKSYKKEL
jgi:hypothetical protein